MAADSKQDASRMTDWRVQDRPREKLLAYGAEALTDEELLAILFRTGVKGCNVFELAHRFVQALKGREDALTEAYAARRNKRATGDTLDEPDDVAEEEATSLYRLWTYDREALKAFIASHQPLLKGIGKDKLATLLSALEFGARVFRPTPQTLKKPLLRGSAIAQLMFAKTARYVREGFWVLYLDRRRVLMQEPDLITLGVPTQTLIDPQTLFRKAVILDARYVILVHNHPSGDVRPSDADIETTQRLIAAGRILGIPVLDHIILGRPDITPSYYSLNAHGHCTF